MFCRATRSTKRRRLSFQVLTSNSQSQSFSTPAAAFPRTSLPTQATSFPHSIRLKECKNRLQTKGSITIQNKSLYHSQEFRSNNSTYRISTPRTICTTTRINSAVLEAKLPTNSDIDHDKLAPPPMNEVQVPLISPHLRAQIFPPRFSTLCPPPPSKTAIDISVAHLTSHGLLARPKLPENDSPPTKPKKLEPAIDFLLPQLQGNTIVDHFQNISSATAEPYLSLAKNFTTFSIPPMPEKGSWSLSPGWTHYHSDGSFEPIPFPHASSDVLVFDVETLPFVGQHFPVMAVAVGKEGWYSWSSPWLSGHSEVPNHLIPFDSPSAEREAKSTSPLSLFEEIDQAPRLLIGHNVLFDRARVGTEYSLRRPSNRWLDTQSLHVAVSGLTSPQRPSWIWHQREKKAIATQAALVPMEDPNQEEEETSKKKSKTVEPTIWQDVSAMNSLAHVALLHCKIKIDKSLVQVFIDRETTIQDVRNNFQDLVHYCAMDVLTTYKVYQVLLPKFLSKCPHPASFSGILLMSQPILPVDARWPLYLERTQKMYEERVKEVQDSLHLLAEEARGKMNILNSKTGRFVWEEDLWLKQLDWSPKKARRSLKSKQKTVTIERTSKLLPNWFAKLKKVDSELVIPPLSPLAAILFKVTYRSFPTFYSHSLGWLFAVPARKKSFGQLPQELLINPAELDPRDEKIRLLKQITLYKIPSGGKKRVKLLVAKDLAAGVLASEHVEIEIALKGNPTPTESAQLVSKLSKLAEAAIVGMSSEGGAIGAKDLVLRQLDWTPVTVLTESPSNSTSALPSPVEKQDLFWPAWYSELDKPGKGLEMTIGKRASPLLLRLQWRGFPLAVSHEFGWTFRIPRHEAPAILQTDASLSPLSFKLVKDVELAADEEGVYVKLPHTDGETKNVGNPLSKSFVSHFEAGTLSSEYATAKKALELNASCSYWASAKERITTQMVIWNGSPSNSSPNPATIDLDHPPPSSQGIILPQVTPMGTVTRRAVERTWLTASNAKKNRVGSELKSMVRAPPGYSIVGADVDSEELWICSVMGDAQFGIHGATAIGWMTLEGTKSAGTDLHSKTASILGISRDDAKVFNYSRIYGAGVKHAVQLLLKADGKATKEGATLLAKNLYASTKGIISRDTFNREFWHGGTESFVFNKLEEIAKSEEPLTPALGCGISDALTKKYLPSTGRNTYLPSRINWVVQSSGVDYLHCLLVSMEYLTKRFGIDARYMISVHDEVRYLVKEEDKYRAAMAMQISNLWTRALFSHRLQIADLPQSCAFFSAVDVDHCFRKEVNMTCLTPSNPDSIPFGESLDIAASLATTSHGSLFADGRSMEFEKDLEQIGVGAIPFVREDQHRVSDTTFLVAQTEKSTNAIRRLWDGVNPNKKSTSRSKSYHNDIGSSLSLSEMKEMQSHSSSIKLSASQFQTLPKKVYRSQSTPPSITRVASIAKPLGSSTDWDDEEIPSELEEEHFSEASSSADPRW